MRVSKAIEANTCASSATTRAIATIGFLLVPGFALLSYAAAVEPLRAANQLAGKELYRWAHCTPSGAAAPASNGVSFRPDFALGEEPKGLDLLLVCAGGNPTKFHHQKTFAALRSLSRRGVALGGISGGPILLAKAGVLNGRRCTVHWEHAPALEESFPHIELTGALFEIDGGRITCSGGIAALDMMISLIRRDHGYSLAAAVSDWFLHTHIRDGAGPQRLDLRHRLGVGDAKLLRALSAMEAHIETPLPRMALARLSGISLRQLERSFERHLGKGMHEHYLTLRLQRARQLLAETSLPVFEIALATGFRSASQFARAFRQAHSISPQTLRANRVGKGRSSRMNPD